MDNKADFTKEGHEKGCAAAVLSSLIASERGPPAVRDWRGRETGGVNDGVGEMDGYKSVQIY